MPSRKRLWASWIVQILISAFLLFDSTIHIINPPFVAQSFQQMGYQPSLGPVIGAIELIFLILYLIPRTSAFGALLLTGYLGGAVDANVRAGNPLLTFTLTPVYAAIFVWGALWLRDERVRNILKRKSTREK